MTHLQELQNRLIIDKRFNMESKRNTKTLLKRFVFWASVILLPGGSLILLYSLLTNAKFNKYFFAGIRKMRKKEITNEPDVRPEYQDV